LAYVSLLIIYSSSDPGVPLIDHPMLTVVGGPIDFACIEAQINHEGVGNARALNMGWESLIFPLSSTVLACCLLLCEDNAVPFYRVSW
jgi:hypothetical protein